MRRVILGVFAAVVGLVLLVVLCTFVKRPYERVLLNRFGSLIEDKDQARICYNWFLKYPTDSVIRIDTRLHLYTSPLQELTTAKTEPISIRTFAAWRIIDPTKFYYTFGGSDERAQATMETILVGLVPKKISTHQLDELFNADVTKIHSDDIEKEVARDATEGDGKEMKGLRSMGIEVVEVGFSRMAFPPANAEKVYERMVAELNKQAIDYQAQGLAAANTIRAEGMQAAAKERADAQAEAQRIRGQGDAEALSILAGVQTDERTRAFYQYWKSLEFLKTSLTKNTILVLPSNAEILQNLFQSPATERSILPLVKPEDALKAPAAEPKAPAAAPKAPVETQPK